MILSKQGKFSDKKSGIGRQSRKANGPRRRTGGQVTSDDNSRDFSLFTEE